MSLLGEIVFESNEPRSNGPQLGGKILTTRAGKPVIVGSSLTPSGILSYASAGDDDKTSQGLIF